MKYFFWLFVSLLSSTTRCMTQDVEAYPIHFYGQEEYAPGARESLLEQFAQGGEKVLTGLDYVRYSVLRLELRPLLEYELEMFDDLNELVLQMPNVPVYVEGLMHEGGPTFFDKQTEDLIKDAFLNSKSKTVTEEQEVYLVGYGAARVLNAIGVIKLIFGLENPHYHHANTELALLNAECTTKAPTDFATKLVSDTRDYLDHAREQFVAQCVSEDHTRYGFEDVVIIFSARHAEKLEKAFFESRGKNIWDDQRQKYTMFFDVEKALGKEFAQYEKNIERAIREMFSALVDVPLENLLEEMAELENVEVDGDDKKMASDLISTFLQSCNVEDFYAGVMSLVRSEKK